MIGAEVVGHQTSKTGQTLPRPTFDEFYAPFKQLQHVRVAHTVKSRLGAQTMMLIFKTLVASQPTQHANTPT